ncbi:kinase binding protein CGI-121-domain-containing protein [Xylaria bambusicola]|uniref:kinase binding protein CGI-121-domain-containing protein n=1 Tax=Xylaria bambusicola TaxID=326684 RepID=UPI00200866EB|nr:kinase binding protein CGI-121-domain-containing protein [Xylaria bambusicola]KAI0509074.1 kinase binding protein CGI-121-domain-containing protein [Xylaria bambusicola]
MGSNFQEPSKSTKTPDSQNKEAGLRLTPSAKRQKIDHHQIQPQGHPHSAVPEANGASQQSTMSSTSVLETLQLEHVPSTHSVHVAVFRGVENAAFLHQQLLARNADFEYALIDAAVIPSRMQVLSAAFKAITLQVAGALKTPNVHSEMVYALSPTSNIAEAYRRYGITPTTKDLVVVKVLVSPPSSSSAAAQDVEKHLLAHVKGQPAPFTDETLSALTDWGRVRKYYKLNGMGWLDGIKDAGAKNREMGTLVMGGMALRGV